KDLAPQLLDARDFLGSDQNMIGAIESDHNNTHRHTAKCRTCRCPRGRIEIQVAGQQSRQRGARLKHENLRLEAVTFKYTETLANVKMRCRDGVAGKRYTQRAQFWFLLRASRLDENENRNRNQNPKHFSSELIAPGAVH